MQIFNKKIAAIVMLAVFATPMMAFADTTDVQSQIKTLLAQIQALQLQLKTLVASSTTGGGMGWSTGSSTKGWLPGSSGGACITLNRTLHQGDQGDDVKNLQTMLSQDPDSDFQGSATGFFGPLTAHAMMMFQMHNGIASSSDGSVGPRTRGFFEGKCGGGAQGQGGMGKMPGGDMMGGVRGIISAVSSSSITIQSDNGASVTADFTASTPIKVFNGTSTPPTSGSLVDLVVGKRIAVMGPTNIAGFVRAVSIAVGDNIPMMKMGGGDGTGGGSGDSHGPMMPVGMMPTTNGPQHGPGTNGGPQNW